MNEKIRRMQDISAELSGISLIICALESHLDPDAQKAMDVIGTDGVQTALFGVRLHIERIAEELAEM